MTYNDYKPFYLDHITEISDSYYIFNGYPQMEYNEDMYYEIHIDSKFPITHFKHYIDNYIVVDLIASDKLEIYYGEFYSESYSDGEVAYNNYSYRVFEKASKIEWKSKCEILRKEFGDLLSVRMPTYLSTRNKVIINYQTIYDQQSSIIDYFKLDNPEIVESRIFGTLYFLFDRHSGGDHLFKLVTRKKKQFLTKDWKQDYLDLKALFNYLLDVNLTDYELLKNHVIDIYTDRFTSMMGNFRYNYRDIDEQKYHVFFNSLIAKLRLTEV